MRSCEEKGAAAPKQPRELNDNQKAFVQAYVSMKPRCGYKAALAAGYSENGIFQTAHRLLRNPKVLAAIREFDEDVLADVRIRAEEVHNWIRDQYAIVSDPDSEFYNPAVASNLLGHAIKMTGSAPTAVKVSGDKDGEPIKVEAEVREIGDMDIAARLAALEAVSAEDGE